MENASGQAQSIAISGTGCVLATGIGTDALWRAARAGHSGITALNAKGFHSRRVKAFGHVDSAAQQYCRERFPRNLQRYVTAPIIWGVNAVQQALTEADVDPRVHALRFGLFCCQGGYTHPSLESFAALLRECSVDAGLDTRRLVQRVLRDGALDPFLVLKALTNGLMGIVSLIYQIEGEANAFMQGVAGNQAALRAARAALLDERIDIAIVVGAGSELDPLGLAALVQAGVIAANGTEIFRPFDSSGGGGIAGEGAAALVLRRSRDIARAGQTCLADMETHPSRENLSLPTAPVDLLVCAGSGTPNRDRALCELLKPVGAKHVTSSQPLTGILSAAPSLVDLIFTRAALQSQCVPPIAGLQQPLDRELGLAMAAQAADLRSAAIINVDDNGFSACYQLTCRDETYAPNREYSAPENTSSSKYFRTEMA